MRAIFFDLDGTLADSLGFLYECYLETLQQYGKTAPLEEFLHIVEMPYYEGLQHVQQKHGISDSLRFFKKLFEKGNREYAEQVQLFPGARELLQKLSQKVDLYITTSSEASIAHPFVEKQQIARYFVDVVTPPHGSKVKPDPYIYLEAIKRSKIEQERIIVVEDSNVGVIAAQKAGLEVVVVEHGHLRVPRNDIKKFQDLFALQVWLEKNWL